MLLSQDPYRPELHFTAPFGWLNDPNGLVYVNGEWHLFYQYYPYGNKWNDMHWGHAVSTDLTNWKHLPIALKPNELGVCFSGSAVIDHNNTSGFFESGDLNLVAFYTNTMGLSPNQADGLQMNSVASSKDGITFDQHVPINPIIPNTGLKNFRDPKVFWHEESQRWVMVLTEGEEVGIYNSENLTEWTRVSGWGKGEAYTDGGPFECPDLFSIVDDKGVTRWVMVMGTIFQSYTEGSGTQYVIGDFDGKTFTRLEGHPDVLWMDYGKDFYATQSWSNTPNDRNVAIAWMSNWLYSNDVPATSHRSAMSFPRELALVTTSQGLRMAQTFASDGMVATDNCAELWGRIIKSNETVTLSDPELASMIDLELSLDNDTEVLLSPFNSEALQYRIKRTGNGYQVAMSRQRMVDGDERYQQNFACEYNLELADSETLSLSIVRDRTSCEIIYNDGTVSTTDCAFTHSFGEFNLEVLQGNAVINTIKESVKG